MTDACDHRPSRERPSACCKCGHALEPDRALPDHVAEMFRALGEVLESAGHKPRDLPCPEYEAYRQHSLSRARVGQELYGERWRRVPTIPEALEELPDAANYTAAEIAKEGMHPMLMQGLMHAYLSYWSYRQYQADKRAAEVG